MGQYTKPTEFFHGLKFENVPRELVLKDLHGKDLNEGKQEFLMTAFGRINDAIAAADVAR